MALRQSRLAQESEALQGRVAQLVRERQDLREKGASDDVLEENRLDIVQAQLELSQALVSEHLAATAA